MGIHARNILDVFAKLIRALECPVCYDYVSSPIWQCNAGHIICGSCKSKISSCPTCRQSFSTARVRSLEQISDIMIFPCMNEGCEQMLPLNEIHSHEARCTLSGARGNLDGEAKTMVVQYNILKHIENNIAPFFVTANNNKECETVKMHKDASTSTSYFPSKFDFVKAVEPNHHKKVKGPTYCSSINKIDWPKNCNQSGSNSQSNNTIFRFNANVHSSNNNSTLFSNVKYSTRHDPNRKMSPTTSCRTNKKLPRRTPQTSESSVCSFFSLMSVGSNSLLNVTNHKKNYEDVLTFSKLSSDMVPHSSVKSAFRANVLSASSSLDDSSIENNSPVSVTPSPQNLPIGRIPAAVDNEDSQVSDIISLTNSLSFPQYLDNNNVNPFKSFSGDATNTTSSNINCLPSSPGLSTCEINDNTKITTSNVNASVSDRCNTNKHIPGNTIFTFNNNITISTQSPYMTPTVSGNMFSGIDTSSNRGTSDVTSFGNVLCKDIPYTEATTSSSDNRSKPISLTEYINRSQVFRDNIKMLPTENQFFNKPNDSLSGHNPATEIQSSSARCNTGNFLPCVTDNICFENLNISSKTSANLQEVEQHQPFKMYKPNETVCFKFCKPNDNLQKTVGIFQFQG